MKKGDWIKRIARRSDITSNVVHLTKASTINGHDKSAIDVLVKILKEGTLKGSDTKSGFIVGNRKAVCFQESPLHSVCENSYYEQSLSKDKEGGKIRYSPIGLVFSKEFIYKSGGRPVIYDKTSEAKKYLPKDQWWRIVNFDLSDKDNIIDWTHEREWRVPDELKFELKDISIVVVKHRNAIALRKKCKEQNINIDEVKSITILQDILF